MTAKIIQGEDRSLNVVIKTSEGKCFDLTGNTEITACFKETAGTFLSVTKTGGSIVVNSDEGGDITITLTDSETALLKMDKTADFEILVDIGTTRRIVQFVDSLEIVKRICV